MGPDIAEEAFFHCFKVTPSNPCADLFPISNDALSDRLGAVEEVGTGDASSTDAPLPRGSRMADLISIPMKEPTPRPVRHGRSPGPRVLIYSHDTFGLGHLRRSRAIANAIVAREPDTSVVIISGSPVIGNFEFGSGVDYIRIPGVTKLPDGDYRCLNLNVSLDEAVRLR